ncbi:MAG: hypothetical protein FWD57_16905 [Polyangiaceae bacterium]|nr:hypothetical protein [Polyangiaceae bacterium]
MNANRPTPTIETPNQQYQPAVQANYQPQRNTIATDHFDNSNSESPNRNGISPATPIGCPHNNYALSYPHMRRSQRHTRSTLATIASLTPIGLLIAACNSDNSTPTTNTTPDADTSDSASSLTINSPRTITLAPGTHEEISITVEPQDTYDVRFLLRGDSKDASLDTSRRVTNSDGTTSVVLTAPSSATTFLLNASAGGAASDEVAVSVSQHGFANVRVTPSYKGNRKTPTWTASAVTGATCTEIPGQPLNDGPIVATAKENAPLLLESLPVGPTIAITLRSEKSTGGCSEITDLTPGETRILSVRVSDMPVQFPNDGIRISMEMDNTEKTMTELLEDITNSFVESAFPTTKPEATTILDYIEHEVPDPIAFSQARTASEFDKLLTNQLDTEETHIATRIRSWIQRGLKPVLDGSMLIGSISPVQGTNLPGTTVPGADSIGLLALENFHGLPIAAAGIPKDHLVSLSVESGDTLTCGGKVTWLPSRLVGAAGNVGALESESTPNAAQAIAHIVSCSKLGSLLHSTSSQPLYCDAACLAIACDHAITALWNHATSSSAPTLDTIQTSFAISGTASVDGNATITGLNAAWIGTQSRNDTETPIRGSANGTTEAITIH